MGGGSSAPSRPTRRGGAWVAHAGAFLLALAVLVVTHLDLLQHPSDSARNDFRTFYAAFHAVGDDVDLYEVEALSGVARETGIGAHVFPYLYPPTLAALGRPLAALSPKRAQVVWDWLSLVAMALAATLALACVDRSGRASLIPVVILLLLLLPVRNNLHMGQVNPLVLVPVAAACLAYLRGWDRTAGAALAVAALIKLVPVVLLLLWVARRRYRAVAAFLVTGLAGALLVALAVGLDRWLGFLGFAVDSLGGDRIEGLFALDVVWSFSPKSAALRAFGPGAAASIASLAVVAGVAIWLFRRARRAPSDASAAPLLLGFSVLMLLSSPVTYLHHVVYLLPGALAVLGTSTRRAYWLVLLVVIVGTDLPLLYGRLDLSAALKPLATGVNLWGLLAIVWLSAPPLGPPASRREGPRRDWAKKHEAHAP